MANFLQNLSLLNNVTFMLILRIVDRLNLGLRVGLKKCIELPRIFTSWSNSFYTEDKRKKMNINKKKFLRWFSILGFSALALISCASPKMLLPGELATKGELMPVKIKKFWYLLNVQSLSFGPFQVSKVNQGWHNGSDFTVGFGPTAYAVNESKQRFGFSIKSRESSNWTCECKALASQKNVEGKLLGGDLLIPLEKQISFDCSFNNPSDSSTWNLNLSRNGLKSAVLAGELSDGKSHILIESTDKTEQSNYSKTGTVGYLFRENSNVLAAVETLYEKKVWMASDARIELRPQLGATAAALVLFQEIFNASLKSDK